MKPPLPLWLARLLCWLDSCILPEPGDPPYCLRCTRRLWLL